MIKLSPYFCIGIYFIICLNILIGQSNDNAYSTSINQSQKIKVFIECENCRFDYLLKELTYVDNVRDPMQAQIYILVTEQSTAAKGKRYDLSFKGNEDYENLKIKKYFTVTQSETEMDLQNKFSKMLLYGLMNYFTGNEILKDYEINYTIGNKENNNKQLWDDWDSWVFNLKVGGGLKAEESNFSVDFKSTLSAEKITDKWKIMNKLLYETENEKFIDEESSISKELNSKEFESKIIYSLSDNWSSGIIAQINSSTYHNIELSYGLSIAAEYNFLPWKLSANKYMTIGYYAGINKYGYNEETLFNKLHEILFNHSAILAFRFIEKWGSFQSKLKFSQFPILESKYKIQFESDLSLRVFEGLSVSLELNAESIHDQIYLASGVSTLEELLLKKNTT